MGEREELRRPVGVLLRQVQHLTKLVDDLLEVSRITRGKIRLDLETLDMTTVVHRAVEISRPLIDAKHHELTVSVPPEPVWVSGDATRLAQVLGNLLNNAAKYTEDRGRIRVALEHSPKEVVLRVTDTGIGIAADLLPRLFELFTQAETSLDRSQGGLGIGLTLARGLVELHHGTLEARSEGRGKGSEFIVRLPVALDRPKQKTDAEGVSMLAEIPSSRIVIVDDNVDAAETLEELLRDAGHQVKVAYDGLSAIEAVRAFHPTVVLLDIGLPRMDGYEVARRLRQEHGSKLLLVALTGYGQEEDRHRAKSVGFDHHLVKPLDLVALSRALARRPAK
jgi:CheY-like chemotaxis protein/two-component sensor histidine kinase